MAFLPRAPTVRASYNIDMVSTALPRERYAAFSLFALFFLPSFLLLKGLRLQPWSAAAAFNTVSEMSLWLLKFKLVKIKEETQLLNCRSHIPNDHLPLG